LNPTAPRRVDDLRIAVDIGGTFTDLVALDAGGARLHYTKALTTYDRLSRGVEDCLRKATLDLARAGVFVHGSTIAINTVIQNTGAVTGLLTTRGFRDAYEIGRSNRPDAYDLAFERPVPLIPRDLRIELDERLNAAGRVLAPLDEAGVRVAVRRLRERGVVAIAVVLLHAYANPVHELRVREIVAEEYPGCHVSLSHEILREFREYERTSTTALNAYVAPIVSGYVEHLEGALAEAGFRGLFLIMQSNGGTMAAEVAKVRPAAMMESGPVAGVIGSGHLGRAMGIPHVISFDMGGTTAKSSLLADGVARVVTGYHIGGYATGHPMMLPVVDIVEVGTGGGSIAWLDASGGLKVGPRSAGASPGPVCYGLGGTEPTVTDANLVLGRLSADNFLGGTMRLDVDAARQAIERRIATPLGLGLAEAALGILRIADTKMSLAVREVSVAKGHDPRDFALVAQGGAGPLHACAIARELAIPTVVVPELPGTFSALGMLFADVRHDYVQTFIGPLAQIEPARVDEIYARMAAEGSATLAREGVPADRATLLRSMDLRYQGQEYTLTVPLPDGPVDRALLDRVRTAFDDAHHAQYSHRAPSEGVEMVNLRLSAIGRIGADGATLLARRQSMEARPAGFTGRPRPVWFEGGRVDCPVYFRSDLEPGQVIDGPAVVEELVSTTVVYPGDRLTVHRAGPLVITVRGA
jgi:N-methylhydantoinase A